MVLSILSAIKGFLFPRSYCDEAVLLHAATTGRVKEFIEILGDSSPDMRLADGETILSYIVISQFMNSSSRLEVLEALSACGVTVDLPNKEGTTPLMLSTGMGEVRLCRALIGMGASVHKADKQGDTALVWAASTNKLDSLQVLIERGANVNHKNKLRRTALMYAARNGNLGYLKELLDGGAEPSSLDCEGTSALSAACSLGRRDAVELLAPLTPQLCESLSLLNAAAVGFDDLVKTLLDKSGAILERNGNGFTALELAVLYQRKTTVELLIPYYANEVNIIGAALSAAALNNSLELMELLLNYNADPNSVDEIGNTPLIHASGNNHAEAVALLLKSGANLCQKNHADNDAQDVAQSNRAYDALQVLFKAR